MSSPKKKNRFWRIITHVGQQLIGVFSDLSTALNTMIQQPLSDFRRSARTQAAKKQSSSRTEKGWLATAIRFPIVVVVAILSVLVKILISPLELIVGLFSRNYSTMLIALPSIAMLVIGGYFVSQWGTSDESIEQHRQMAHRQFVAGNYQRCIQEFEQLAKLKAPLNEEETFFLACSLHKANRDREATPLLERLAPPPGKSIGYPPAHQLVAISTAAELGKTASPAALAALKWHLDAGGESAEPALNRAWAEYYLRVDDDSKALEYMKRAAQVKPEFMILVADIYLDIGNRPAYLDALAKARKFFEDLVIKQPKVVKHRVMLSRIFFELGEFVSAERTLLDAYSNSKSPELETAIAEFYLRQYRETQPFVERFQLLRKCLSYDLNHIPAYEAMIQLYRESSDERKQQIISILELTIANNDAAALSHFALSNILWTEDQRDESKRHMEKAFELNPKGFAVVANNLAWILAHSEPPEQDLERAHQLSKQIVETHPHDGRLRDTFARVLMKQERYNEALAEFHRALPTVTDKAQVHLKMAEICDLIGKPSLAQRHRQQANKR